LAIVRLWKLPSSVTGHLTICSPAVSSSDVHTTLMLPLLTLSLFAEALPTAAASTKAAVRPASSSFPRVRIDIPLFVGADGQYGSGSVYRAATRRLDIMRRTTCARWAIDTA
jgi:hypothetical protein